MDKNLFEFNMLKMNLNQQLEVLRNSKARFIMELNEATASLNADREEMGEKEEERDRIEQEYKAYMQLPASTQTERRWVRRRRSAIGSNKSTKLTCTSARSGSSGSSSRTSALTSWCAHSSWATAKCPRRIRLSTATSPPTSLASAACPATTSVPTRPTRTGAAAGRC